MKENKGEEQLNEREYGWEKGKKMLNKGEKERRMLNDPEEAENI